ncbi:DUF6544 family protein [Nonomuraea endophytica]|uniref:DUF6544 family protein n=1 Tax=Nonomuraea endophytica TaxID=714136 RepID=UPI0037C7E6F4
MNAPHLTPQARTDWDLLAAPTQEACVFEQAQADHLPQSARRWLLHALAPGTALLRTVELAMHGTIRLGSWRPFDAVQVIAPLLGYVWAATTHLAGLPLGGFDRYRGGEGQMRWRLLGRIPVMSMTGADVARSAAGRLACEFILTPAVALDPRIHWKAVDELHAVARFAIDEEDFEVTLRVGPSGALETASLSRWGNPDKRGFREHVFGVVCERESVFDGVTIPSVLRCGWWPEEFIRITIDWADFR